MPEITASDEVSIMANRLREILSSERDSLLAADLNNLLGLFPDVLLTAMALDRLFPSVEDSFRTGFADLAPEDWREIFSCLKNETLAIILASLPISADGRPNRKLALEAADMLGPEKGQDLYHFAVLTTRLT